MSRRSDSLVADCQSTLQPEELYTYIEAAEVLGCTPSNVSQMFLQHKLGPKYSKKSEGGKKSVGALDRRIVDKIKADTEAARAKKELANLIKESAKKETEGESGRDQVEVTNAEVIERLERIEAILLDDVKNTKRIIDWGYGVRKTINRIALKLGGPSLVEDAGDMTAEIDLQVGLQSGSGHGEKHG